MMCKYFQQDQLLLTQIYNSECRVYHLMQIQPPKLFHQYFRLPKAVLLKVELHFVEVTYMDISICFSLLAKHFNKA